MADNVLTEVTLRLPEGLARRVQPMSSWLPTIFELSLRGFETPAAQTAAEIVAFLTQGPSPAKVLAYTVSARAQQRLRRLLALNAAGLLGAEEQIELDELEYIEHLLVLLKAQAAEA